MTTATAASAELDDSGLARERTRLAWSRSALSLLTTAALAFHAAIDEGRPLLACLVAATVALVALAARAWGRAAYEQRHAGDELRVTQRTLVAGRLLAAGTTAIGLIALALVAL